MITLGILTALIVVVAPLVIFALGAKRGHVDRSRAVRLARIGRLWAVFPHQVSPDESASRRGLRYAVAIQAHTSIWREGQTPLPPAVYKGTGRPPKLLRRDEQSRPVSVQQAALDLPASIQATRVRSDPRRADAAAARRTRFERTPRIRSASGSGPEKNPPMRVVMPVTPRRSGSESMVRSDSISIPV